MKRENMKVGMKVVVKPNAIGLAKKSIGKVVRITRIDSDCPNGWTCGGFLVMPEEVRKATQHEILASMTTQELQQLLDEIDVELDKRLAAVHPDARYMFRECVVDGHTCYVMGFGDWLSKEPCGFLLVEGHSDGCHSGDSSFLDKWVGRRDLTWKAKCLVKLVNEDGSLEDVL